MPTMWWRSLAAEWLRLSRRWDIWLVAGLVLAAGTWMYINAFHDSIRAMGIGEQGGWGSGEGLPPDPWYLDAMLSLRQPFAFPASLLTVLDSAWIVLPLGAYVAAVTIGPDFWWGTMRSILVTRRSRVAYLAQRLSLITIIVAVTLLALLVVTPLAQVVLLAAAGERFPATSLQADVFLGMLATRVFAAVGYMLIAAALTLLARSLVGGIVLLAAFAGAELAVGAVATSIGAPIVRELTFVGAMTSIVDHLRPPPVQLVVDYTLGALVPATHQPAAPVHLLSVEASALVIAGWILLAGTVAFLRMRTMDVLD